MGEAMLIVNAVLLLAVIGLIVLVLRRGSGAGPLQLTASLEVLEKSQERLERVVREEFARSREESASQARQLREEIGSSLKNFNDTIVNQMTQMSKLQKDHADAFLQRITTLTQSNEQKLETMRQTVEKKLTDLQEDNSKKLDQMRQTVDEKLQGTLDRRLTESFKLVGERLEQVYKGLGDMQKLATDVGDFKKVLTNVKVRGTWGEIQLGNLLEQILSPEQYAQNVVTKEGSNERVEFALKLPGKDDAEGQVVWLPIDAKFPMEDYQRIMEASEQGDVDAVEAAARQLEVRVRTSAKDIRDKYISPPSTTDFGIMFLPSEGLYAEVLRRPGLVELLQREYRVSVAGPTTLAALLNALQMGFQTLAIQKRSGEVWEILRAVKTEFGKFGEVLGRVQKKLHEAGEVIDKVQVRSRAIERRLRDVQELPPTEAQGGLGEAAPLSLPETSPEPENGSQDAAF